MELGMWNGWENVGGIQGGDKSDQNILYENIFNLKKCLSSLPL